MDTQWEYKFFDCNTGNPEKKEKELNDLGEENWEVVSAASTNTGSNPTKLILKRPKRTQKRNDDYGYGR